MADFMGLTVDMGQTIPAETVLKLQKVKANHTDAQYAFAMMSFAKKLETFLRKEGYAANVKTVSEGVRWLTDEEGLTHNVRRRKTGKRKIRNALRGLNNVNEGQLTPAARDVFEREHRQTAQEVMAIRGVAAVEMAVPFGKRK